ncbi:hypothetical protein AX16_006440 [Volvariella volvacea WC 439]|nr:hypothetical protein AX16_006440 [Volvariella volvacea WC 439]
MTLSEYILRHSSVYVAGIRLSTGSASPDRDSHAASGSSLAILLYRLLTTTSVAMLAQLLAVATVSTFALAQHSGHGSAGSDSSAGDSMGGMSHGTFHFTPGDTILFQGWTPTSNGAMVGTCIGLFLLGIGERWLSSLKANAERTWSARAQLIMTNRLNAAAGGKDNHPISQSAPSLRSLLSQRQAPPLILAHDVPRAVLHMIQLTLGYGLMLIVMTFNLGFLFSVVLGEGPRSQPLQVATSWVPGRVNTLSIPAYLGSTYPSPILTLLQRPSKPRNGQYRNTSSGSPRIPPVQLLWSSYAEDPKWQTKFSIIWASVAAAAIIYSLPSLVHAVRTGRALTDFFGVYEVWDSDHAPKQRVERSNSSRNDAQRPTRGRKLRGLLQTLSSTVYWSSPGINLNAGQAFLIATYIVTVLVCMIYKAPLKSNSNRAGFLAVAQLPLVFLFATKNSILSLLLGPGNGYEKLNFIHRWVGRSIFICAVIHGSMWIENHLRYRAPIMGEEKEMLGIAAFALLCIIVLSSLKPVRKWFYDIFFFVHVLTFVAFFVTICYHTPYATPWIFPPLAFYGCDFLLRLLRMRIKDAYLTPVSTQMTVIRIPHADGGWIAGQHVRLRVFFGGRVLESHPLTILSAPPPITCLSSPGIYLGSRSVGDWTRALNKFAISERDQIIEYLQHAGEKADRESVEVPVSVMIDGPYGGSSVDLGNYESVLLLAGGSGATFTIGLLDDIVGRCVKLRRPDGERTRRIHFAWCVRSFGALQWFLPMLSQIAGVAASSSLDLYITIFVTCLCDPDTVPPLPNCDVLVIRPSAYVLLQGLITPPPTQPTKASEAGSVTSDNNTQGDGAGNDVETVEAARPNTRLRWCGLGGGVAVCVSGPGSLIRETSNAVARLGMTRGAELGGIALHTELFSL